MRDIAIEENIIFSEVKGNTLSLNITATSDEPMIRRALKTGVMSEMKFSFELKDILQSIKSGYELGGREKGLYLSKHYSLINTYRKELQNELRKIEELEYIVNGTLEEQSENNPQVSNQDANYNSLNKEVAA